MREKTRVDTIYETLRDRICLGQYQPGDVLHETNLGQEFEVSRTPIRQVLQRLSFEKLAVVRTGVGTIVEDFTRTDAQNYLEMHARILATVAELELVEPAEDMDEAAATLQVRMGRLSAAADPERFWLLLKTVQDVSHRLLADDLLRHVDELLFFRSGPALMAGVRADPVKAVAVFEENVSRLMSALDSADSTAYFNAQSRNLRANKALIASD